MNTKLTTEIKNSRSKEECEKLLNICDDLENHIPVFGYTIKDLPTKEIYETFAKKCNHINIYERECFKTLFKMHSLNSNYSVNKINDCLFYPNFEGVDVMIEFVKKDNEFIPNIAQLRNKDITKKMKYFIKCLSFTDIELFKNVLKIVITGKFLCKQRFIYETGKSAVNHFSLAITKLNSTFEDFQRDLERFDFIGLEINAIVKDSSISNINQSQVLKLFNKKLNCVFFDDTTHRLYNEKFYSIELSDITPFYQTYLEILESTEKPTKGLVYCSKKYVYSEDFKEDKFIWYPPRNEQYRIVEIHNKITKHGFVFKVDCEDINIYGNTKISFDISLPDLEKFIKIGFGVGAICSYELTQNFSKRISNILIPADETFFIPKYCPKCRKQLDYEYKNDKLTYIKCYNPNCPINLPESWFNFISKMCKYYKKENDEMLLLYDAEKKVLKRMFPIERLYDISAQKHLTKDVILEIAPTIFNEFDKLTLEKQICVLGLANTEKQAEKIIAKNNYSTISDLPFVWIYNL